MIVYGVATFECFLDPLVKVVDYCNPRLSVNRR
jgi:hypothetical protein